MGAPYNATVDLIERNLVDGRRDRTAVIDNRGATTYAALSTLVNRAGNLLGACAVVREQRVLLVMHDSVELVALFWGAIKAGLVPVPVNTMLTTDDYAYLCADSRARVVVVSRALADKVRPALAEGQSLIVDGDELDKKLAAQSATLLPVDTDSDEVAFWLYSSGSTGKPKGALHLHSSLRCTADLYGISVLGIQSEDVVFSAAKLFFAYGLGNAMTFPFAVGATSVVLAERPTPAAVMRVLRERRPTIFYGVPTLYAAILADDAHAPEVASRLRICVSAGEPLPREVGERWNARFGVPILDGLGSTEMLHIFLSLRSGEIRYGTTGRAVPGYELAIVDDEDRPVQPGELGELRVRGPSSAVGYWNKRDQSRRTFVGAWTHTGDKYFQDADGFYVYAGRADDMIKAGGIWVSPVEVESALIGHPRCSKPRWSAPPTSTASSSPRHLSCVKRASRRAPRWPRSCGSSSKSGSLHSSTRARSSSSPRSPRPPRERSSVQAPLSVARMPNCRHVWPLHL